MSVHLHDAASYAADAAAVYAAWSALPHAAQALNTYNARTSVAAALAAAGPGARFVDLGCGAGAATRAAAALPGTAAAVGVDRSADQLARARAGGAVTTAQFVQADLVAAGAALLAGAAPAAALPPGLAAGAGTFDVALLEFVACHAGTQAALDAMVATAATLLRPGGTMIALEVHPRFDTAPFPPQAKYGLEQTFVVPAKTATAGGGAPVDGDGPVSGGAPGDGGGECVAAAHGERVPSFTKIRTTFVTPVGRLTVDDFFHSVESWRAAVASAGLADVTFDDVVAPPDAAPGFWDDYVTPDHPCGVSHTAVIRAVKNARG